MVNVHSSIMQAANHLKVCQPGRRPWQDTGWSPPFGRRGACKHKGERSVASFRWCQVSRGARVGRSSFLIFLLERQTWKQEEDKSISAEQPEHLKGSEALLHSYAAGKRVDGFDGNLQFCAWFCLAGPRVAGAFIFDLSPIWRHGSAPASLASLLFNPAEPQTLENTVSRDFAAFRAPLPFAHLHLLSSHSFSSLIFSLLLFSSLTLPTSAFPLSILSEVWLLHFLR